MPCALETKGRLTSTVFNSRSDNNRGKRVFTRRRLDPQELAVHFAPEGSFSRERALSTNYIILNDSETLWHNNPKQVFLNYPRLPKLLGRDKGEPRYLIARLYRRSLYDISGIGSDGQGLVDIGNVALSYAENMAAAELRERNQSEAITLNQVKTDASRDMADAAGEVDLLNANKVGEAGATLAQIADGYIKQYPGSEGFNRQLENQMAILLDTHIGSLSTNSTKERRKVLDLTFQQDAHKISNATIDITTKTTTGEPDIITRARALTGLEVKYGPMYGAGDTRTKIFAAQQAMLRSEFSRLMRNPTPGNIEAANTILDHPFTISTMEPDDFKEISKSFMDTTKVQAQGQKKSDLEIQVEVIKSSFPENEWQEKIQQAVMGDKTTDLDKKLKYIENDRSLSAELKADIVFGILTGSVRAPSDGDKLQSLMTVLQLHGVKSTPELALRLAGASPKELTDLQRRVEYIGKMKDPVKKEKALAALMTNNANLNSPSEEGEEAAETALATVEKINGKGAPGSDLDKKNKEQAANIVGGNKGGGTSVIFPKNSTLQKKVAEGFAKSFDTAIAAGKIAEGTRAQLASVSQVLDDALFKPGGFANARLYWARIIDFAETTLPGFSVPDAVKKALGAADSGDQLKAASNRLTLTLAKGIGRILKMSLVMAQESVPNLLKTARGNAIVVALMEREAQRTIDLAQIAQKYRLIAAEAPQGTSQLRDENGISFDQANQDYKKENPFMSEALEKEIRNLNKSAKAGESINIKRLKKSGYNPKPPKSEPGATYLGTDEDGLDTFLRNPDSLVGKDGATKNKRFRVKPTDPADSPFVAPTVVVQPVKPINPTP